MSKYYSYLLSFTILCSNLIFAQAIPRDEYLDYIPLEYPRVVEQTNASKRLNLFGDKSSPSYKDIDPLDGIDDKRNAVFMKMGVRFAPFLVQNTTAVPLDFDVFLKGSSSFPLYIDIWNIAPSKPELVNVELIDFPELRNSECKVKAEDIQDQYTLQQNLNDDCKLLALIEEFNPNKPKNEQFKEAKKSSERELFKVMYFDFPGEGPDSWEEHYTNEFTKQLESKYKSALKNYVHPFLMDYYDEVTHELLGYELFLQYWFFYAYNDGGNNHEGDWEHINVIVSPKDKVERYLTEDEINDVLDGTWIGKDGSDDALVIKRIENYFHHQVMPMDFSKPNVYNSREVWEDEIDNLIPEYYGEKNLLRSIRYRAYVDDDEKIINTHPFVFIGGDNKGTDQLMSMPGGSNRDSHGSYPYPGLYRNIGPAGASEEINVYVDHREYFEEHSGKFNKETVRYERGNVIPFNVEKRITIVPDWERVIDLLETNRDARQDWSWLILPLRWGYPATESPFAGIVKHADTGNQGDIGPTFTEWWNTSMDTRGVHKFNPHQLPPIFPVGFQDNFNNSIGFLNITYPILFNLPPLDIAWRVAVYPFRGILGKNDPVYYPEKEIPFRFFDLAVGMTWQKIDEDFSYLMFNSDQYDEFTGQLLTHIINNGFDSTTTVTNNTNSLTNPTSPTYQIAFYIGDHFASINSLRHFRSDHSFSFFFSNVPAYNYTSEINFWEYAGTIRYNILTSNIQPYLMLGYGWFWYRVENAKINGKLFESPNSSWINQPSFKSLSSFLPNTFHFGFGLEFIILKSQAKFPKGFDLTIRGEYGFYYNNLGVDFSQISLEKLSLFFPTLGDVPANRTVNRQVFSLILSLGF